MSSIRDQLNEAYEGKPDEQPPSTRSVAMQLNDAQRAQAALVTVLPSQPASSAASSAVTRSTSPSPPPYTAPSVLKIVLPSAQSYTAPQIRRIPLSHRVTLPQLMASVMSVCQMSEPFLLRWDGPAGESVLLKRDEQLRALFDDFARLGTGGGSGGVFKLHVVHKSRRTSRSSIDSPSTSPLAVPSPAAGTMSASVPLLEETGEQRPDDPSQQPQPTLSLSSSAYQTPATAVEKTRNSQQQSVTTTATASKDTVLLIEVRDARALAAYISTHSRYRVETASTSKDAIERFAQLHSSLRCVLIDSFMQSCVDGVEAARLMRQLQLTCPHSRVPIYAIAAHFGSVRAEMNSQYYEAGMSGWIFKQPRIILDVVVDVTTAAVNYPDHFIHFLHTLHFTDLDKVKATEEVATRSRKTTHTCEVVLLVEDERVPLRVPLYTLTRSGFRVEIASTGEEAVERFVQLHRSICSVLIDVELPGNIDGVEAARRMRLESMRTGSSIPIIAMSASWGEQNLRMYEEAGMRGCMYKLMCPVLDVVVDFVQAEANFPDHFVKFPRTPSQAYLLRREQQLLESSITSAFSQQKRSDEDEKVDVTTTCCCACSSALAQITSQLTQLSSQVAAVQAIPTTAPPATCYSETALLTLTAMVESLTATVDSLSSQLQEAETQRKEMQQRMEAILAEREARHSEREADREKSRQERERVRQAEREARRQLREQEKKEQEADRRHRDAEHREHAEQLVQALRQPLPQPPPQQVGEGQHAEGEVETDDMFAAAGSHLPSLSLSAASAPSFGSSLHSAGRAGDESPSLSEEETDMLAPMLESARPLSPSSSAYFLCPPSLLASTSSSASSASSAAGTRLDVMLDRLESEGYGVRSLNALVVSEHGGEEADWNVVVRDLDLYYAQG